MRTKVQAFLICSSISLLLTDADSKLGSQVGSISAVTKQRMKIHPKQHESPSQNTGQPEGNLQDSHVPPPPRADLGAPHHYDCLLLYVLNGDKQ